MLKQSLRKLNFKLVQIINYRPVLIKSVQLLEFYKLIVGLHSNLKQYLRHPCSTPKSRLTTDQSEGSLTKSVPFALPNTIHNEEDILCASFQLSQPKSLKQGQISKLSQQQRIKLAMASSSDKNFQQLMEKINLIILYQNKVEKQLLSINSQEKMAQLCTEQNPIQMVNLSMQNKENQAHLLDMQTFKDELKKVFDECKNIQEVHENFKMYYPDQSVHTLKSQNESHDKKSLLTQMLKESQLIETEQDQFTATKRVGKKPTSEANYATAGKKLLQKEIDFSGYRINGGYPRKQMKDRAKNCGQCSQCALF